MSPLRLYVTVLIRIFEPSDRYKRLAISALLIRILTIHLYHTTIDKWIIYTEAEGICNLINCGKAMNSGFTINVLLNLFWFLFLPRGLNKTRDNSAYSCFCSFKFLDNLYETHPIHSFTYSHRTSRRLPCRYQESRYQNGGSHQFLPLAKHA